MRKSRHPLHNAMQLQRMLDGVGRGSMNILGVFNMLWHNFEINKPMFGLANFRFCRAPYKKWRIFESH